MSIPFFELSFSFFIGRSHNIQKNVNDLCIKSLSRKIENLCDRSKPPSPAGEGFYGRSKPLPYDMCVIRLTLHKGALCEVWLRYLNESLINTIKIPRSNRGYFIFG